MPQTEKNKFLLVAVLPAMLILVVILYSYLGWETGSLEMVVGAIVSIVLGYFGITKTGSVVQKGLDILERKRTQTRDDKEPNERNRKLDEENI